MLGWLIGGSTRRSAAVAVVFRPGPSGAELLFIQRTRRAGDRWSGNVAFPGGLAHPEDVDLVATARRETHEETGLELGEPLRRLTPLLTAEPGRFRPMRVHPIVFTVPAHAEVELNPDEIADAFWVSWRELSAMPRVKVWKRIKSVPFRARAVFLRGRLLWGLTFWMVEELRADRLFDPDAL